MDREGPEPSTSRLREGLRPFAATCRLAAYWGRVAVDPAELPLHERDEDELRAADWPPSRYDDPGALTVKRG
jgi:hypothetical protein